MIRIRLRRTGKKHHPFYRVVVANKPDKRDGDFLETLGSYDPHSDPPTTVLDEAKTREWLGKGAQPSEAAEKILRRAGILTAPAKATAVAVAEPPSKARKGGKKATTAAPRPVAAKAAVDAVADAAPVAESAPEPTPGAVAETAPESTTAVADPVPEPEPAAEEPASETE